MQVTGYMLREALKDHELRKESMVESFDGCLTKFSDEEKPSPKDLMDKIVKEENAIARLQAAQSVYNNTITIEMADEKFSLTEAVKRIGGAERTEKMWRTAMRTVSYAYRSQTRTRVSNLAAAVVSEEHPKLTIGLDEARNETAKAVKRAAKLRALIAQANSTQISISDLDTSLFQ